MTTYNGEKYLKPQLDSILYQLSSQDELIISDDGSSDNTLEIIKSYNDKRIRLLHHVKTKLYINEKYRVGYFCSQNYFNAVSYAKGEYIFLSDQDDVWMDNKIKVFLEYLKNNTLVMSNFSIINDDDDGVVNDLYFIKNPVSNSILNNIMTNPFFGCAMAFRKEILNLILPIPRWCVSYDLWIGCLCIKKYSFCFINKPLHKYRRHGTNNSPATKKSRNNIVFKMFWRMQFIIILFNRFILNK
jgi:glycosyltransferase involved in cell wall biosynthesis